MLNKTIIILWMVVLSVFIKTTEDDPVKKQVKKDTIQVNIKQIQELNKSLNEQLNRLDSLIVIADSTKKK